MDFLLDERHKMTQFVLDCQAGKVMGETQDQMMSKKNVAKLLDVSVRTVDRLLKKGDFPIYRIGGQVKIKKSDVLAYIEGQREHLAE